MYDRQTLLKGWRHIVKLYRKPVAVLFILNLCTPTILINYYGVEGGWEFLSYIYNTTIYILLCTYYSREEQYRQEVMARLRGEWNEI